MSDSSRPSRSPRSEYALKCRRAHAPLPTSRSARKQTSANAAFLAMASESMHSRTSSATRIAALRRISTCASEQCGITYPTSSLSMALVKTAPNTPAHLLAAMLQPTVGASSR